MKNAMRLGLTIAGLCTLAACAASAPTVKTKYDDFRVISKADVQDRWCLNNALTVLQPTTSARWVNAKPIALERIQLTTKCAARRLFDEGDELKLMRRATGMVLEVKRKPQSTRERIYLDVATPDYAQPPYWSSSNGPYDYFVLLAEKTNTQGELVKFYLIEAFDDNETDDCKRERPDSPKALVKMSGEMTCPAGDGPIFEDQTDVGGGGEHK